MRERCVDFVCVGFISGPFRRAMVVFKLSLLSGNRAKPSERPQRVWTGSETAVNCSPCQTLCLFGYSVIAWELQEKLVDCVIRFHYWTTSKRLPAHHLRLHILFWFQINFLMPVFLWNHAHKKTFQNFKSDWNAGRARARKGEAQKLLNGNKLKGNSKQTPYIVWYSIVIVCASTWEPRNVMVCWTSVSFLWCFLHLIIQLWKKWISMGVSVTRKSTRDNQNALATRIQHIPSGNLT